MLAVGLWAWTEKDMFNNINKITNVTLDPALFFILIGLVIFIIGFSGCVGALRENTCLLTFVSHCFSFSYQIIHTGYCICNVVAIYADFLVNCTLKPMVSVHIKHQCRHMYFFLSPHNNVAQKCSNVAIRNVYMYMYVTLHTQSYT